jgi:hypothetical protein
VSGNKKEKQKASESGAKAFSLLEGGRIESSHEHALPGTRSMTGEGGDA